VASGATTINVSGTIMNNGVLEASSGGSLDIVSSINNSSGLLEVNSGGQLIVEGQISGGSATIMAGTLEFDASSNVNVTFDNSKGYGELILGNPEHFSGQISGFSGTAPDAADSDRVELLGFTETRFSVQLIHGNQILTLHDAHGDVVTLTFDNFHGTLNVSTSGGKTFIYDPPAEGSKEDSSTTANSAGSDHAATSSIETAPGGDQPVVAPVTGSFNNASSTAFTASTVADDGLSLGGHQNVLSTDSASPGSNHVVDLPIIGAHQTFIATVSPAVPVGDNVAVPVLNPPVLGDERGHVIVPALNPPAFGGEHVIDPPAPDSSAGTPAVPDADSLTMENGLSGGFTQTALSSLLNVLTGDHAIASSVDTFVLGGDHGTVSTIQTALSGDHATESTIQSALGGGRAAISTNGTPSPFTSSAPGADNFVFHPNLGDDTVHNTSVHATDVGSISGQNSPQPLGLAISVPELGPEIMFAPAYHDAADVSATSQFHQMASSAHLLH